MHSVILYVGSFNPIHKGHLAVAEWILDRKVCDEVWFVVSPQNPLKRDGSLIDERDRLAMVDLAVAGSRYPQRMKACDVEFAMPRPSYTVDTLSVLDAEYPDREFALLVGSDIPGQIHRWKEWRKLLDCYKIYVYPRRGYPVPPEGSGFTLLDGAPFEDYSSTEVRAALAEGGGSDMIPESVKEYIKQRQLWSTTMK